MDTHLSLRYLGHGVILVGRTGTVMPYTIVLYYGMIKVGLYINYKAECTFFQKILRQIFSPYVIHARKMTIFKTLSLAKTLLPLAF